MIDLPTLSLFIDAARRQSFAAVARARDLDPSSVSRAISGLEARVGARLFQRTTRRLTLTDAGRLYLERIEPLLEQIEAAGAEAADLTRLPAGRVRMTCSVALAVLVVAPRLAEFRRAYPDVVVDLVATDANLDLVAERIDVAVRLGPRLDVGYVGVELFQTRYRVVAAPAWTRAHPGVREPADLAGLPCILFDLPGFRDVWRFRAPSGREFEVPVTGGLTSTNALALRAAAVAGAGPALLADWTVRDDLASGALIDLFPAHEVTATAFETAAWLLYPSRAYLPARVRVLIDSLRVGARDFGP
jgi:DNA-binding transcriptional LysR family regulator